LEQAVQKRREDWNGVHDGFLDSYKPRLFVSLWTGDLAVFGKPLPPPGDLSHSAEALNKRDRKWFAEARTSIHASFWDSTRIDWDRSFAGGMVHPTLLSLWTLTTSCGSFRPLENIQRM
jgi:hypothetical protein